MATKARLPRAAETIADVASQAGAVVGRVFDASGAGRLRQLSRTPLPNLFDLHPEARSAPRRQLGVATIPVARIRGTAVEGPAQRGSDFKPLRGLRGSNWRGRWQRLRAANDRLAILPPIDVLQTDDGYWVIDGHNRVALALYSGQDDIDAAVTYVHLPGSRETVEGAPTEGSLEAILADAHDLPAAARGPRVA